MPFPHYLEDPAYEDAMQDLRTLKWLEQQRRNGHREREMTLRPIDRALSEQLRQLQLLRDLMRNLKGQK